MTTKLTTEKSNLFKRGDIAVYEYVNPLDDTKFLTVHLLVTNSSRSDSEIEGCCISVEADGTSHGWEVGVAASMLPVKNWTKVIGKVTVEFIP